MLNGKLTAEGGGGNWPSVPPLDPPLHNGKKHSQQPPVTSDESVESPLYYSVNVVGTFE